MKFMKIAFVAGLAALAMGCANRTGDKSLAEYCANSEKANTDICKINTEIVSVDGRAKGAQARADQAYNLAASASSRADEAYNRQDQVYCETRTIRNASTGSCSQGYTLVGCMQSRFTKRAGGLSIMRDINDASCRFNDRVLEMKVRCCMAGSAALPQEQPVQRSPSARPTTTRTS
jgi:hypothetical protein